MLNICHIDGIVPLDLKYSIGNMEQKRTVCARAFCSVFLLQGFAMHTSHNQRATIGHNMPKYVKIGYKGLNRQKNSRFLET